MSDVLAAPESIPATARVERGPDKIDVGMRQAGSAAVGPPYLYRVMTQGGSAWALRAGEVFCSGVAELAPCP